jgi:hypothetical protein
MDADIKYIDPSYIIRSIPTTSNDRIYCKVGCCTFTASPASTVSAARRMREGEEGKGRVQTRGEERCQADWGRRCCSWVICCICCNVGRRGPGCPKGQEPAAWGGTGWSGGASSAACHPLTSTHATLTGRCFVSLPPLNTPTPPPPPPSLSLCPADRFWRTMRCTLPLLGSLASRWAWSTPTTCTCPSLSSSRPPARWTPAARCGTGEGQRGVERTGKAGGRGNRGATA